MRKILIAALALTVANVSPLLAQTQPKKPSAKPDKNTRVLVFPDFFHFREIKVKDTSYSYELYDSKMQRLNINALKNADQVDHMNYYKHYCRFPQVPNSPVSPPIEFVTVYEYGHPGPNVWVRFDHKTGDMVRYKLFKDKIVRTENVEVINPATNAKEKVIVKYYKAEPMAAQKSQGHHHD